MIAMGLCEICMNQLKERKNGSFCCKAFPDGIPSDRYCTQHCDLPFLDESKKIPVITCPNGYRFEMPDGYLDRRRKEAENY